VKRRHPQLRIVASHRMSLRNLAAALDELEVSLGHIVRKGALCFGKTAMAVNAPIDNNVRERVR
jgi:hypothetical protein